MIVSSGSSIKLEEVAEASGEGLRWFQTYIFQDRRLTEDLVRRAERTGYKALVLTLDHSITGRGLFWGRSTFAFPFYLKLANFEFPEKLRKMHLRDPKATWEDISWFCGLAKLPVILKGILTAEDAREAVRHKVQGIIVSNHGGRHLDGVPATVSLFLFSTSPLLLTFVPSD